MKTRDGAMQRRRLRLHPDVAAPHFAIFHELRRYEFCRVDGDGKAQPLRRHDGRRVHAHNFAARIHQRPARIAGIQRGIRLDHVINQSPRLRSQRASQRADHARRDRALKSHGISDRHHQMADAQPLGIAQGHWRNHRIGAHQCQVAIRVLRHQIGREVLAI